MFFENIKEAIISILSNKMRSLLTMLGIIIGISSVIIITTIGGSIQSTLTATMNSLGGNTVKIRVSLPRIILEAGRSRMRRIPTIMPMSVWMA